MVVVNFANIAIMIAVSASFSDGSNHAKPKIPTMTEAIVEVINPSTP